jgi:hypothetical protein
MMDIDSILATTTPSHAPASYVSPFERPRMSFAMAASVDDDEL